MYKKDLALNNQLLLICHKIKPNLTKNKEPSLFDYLSIVLGKRDGFMPF